MHFSNQNSFLDIGNDVNYNGLVEKIVRKFFFEKNKGKIETESFIIKWSCDKAYIYDKLGSISLLEILNRQESTEMNMATLSRKETVYYVTKDVFVSFIHENDMVYIKSKGQENPVVSKYKNGKYQVYIDSLGNKMELCDVLPCKFNNLFISKI